MQDIGEEMVSRITPILAAAVVLSIVGLALSGRSPGLSLLLVLVFFIGLIGLFVKFAINSSKKRREEQLRAVKASKNRKQAKQASLGGGFPFFTKSDLSIQYKLAAGILAFALMFFNLYVQVRLLNQQYTSSSLTSIFLLFQLGIFYSFFIIGFEEYKKGQIGTLEVVGYILLVSIGAGSPWSSISCSSTCWAGGTGTWAVTG